MPPPPPLPSDDEVERLLVLHKPQLDAGAIPERHWRTMLRKMARGQMDAGETFALTYEEDEGKERLNAVVVKDEGVLVRPETRGVRSDSAHRHCA
jgi:hypothetical protein